MSYKSKTSISADITNIKSLSVSDGKIDAAELQDVLYDIPDSAMWMEGELVLTDAATVVWDYSSGSEAVVTIGANRGLSITNLPTDRVVYGDLLKLGSFTLTLPAGKYSASGAVTGTGRTRITFCSRPNGEIDFNFSPYTGT